MRLARRSHVHLEYRVILLTVREPYMIISDCNQTVCGMWYLDIIGTTTFPMIACITGVGIGGGLVYVTCAWITTSYADDHEKSKFGVVATNVGSIGAVLGTLIALLAARQTTNGDGLPSGVYQGFLAIQLVVLVLVLFIKSPQKTFRPDGSAVEADSLLGFLKETRNCFLALKDPIFLLMIPAFLPARSFLAYNGSINGAYVPMCNLCVNV